MFSLEKVRKSALTYQVYSITQIQGKLFLIMSEVFNKWLLLLCINSSLTL